MPGNVKRYSSTAGKPPGTLIFVGDKRTDHVDIAVMDYDAAGVREHKIEKPEDCRGFLNDSTVTWVNIVGLDDTATLERIGRVFGLHPLVMEDVVHTGQRPKIEDHGEYIFFLFKLLRPASTGNAISVEQVSLIVGKNYVLSFKEVAGDIFGMIRDRIRDGLGRIRETGPDYLAYALLDAVVDHYFLVLEDVGDQIEVLQERVFSETGTEVLRDLHRLKSAAVFLRKNIWPLREVVGELERSESPLINDATAPYLRSVYEHTVQAIDMLEALRDMLSGALEIYLSTSGNRMNEIMKVLTLIATIFIPLTFVAGIYGMNFEYMPELKWRCGYLVVWLIMIAIGVGMWFFFKRRKWL